MTTPVKCARVALVFGLALHVWGPPAFAQTWTVTPNQIDFGLITDPVVERTFVLRVDRVDRTGVPGRPLDARTFPLQILAGAPLEVTPARVEITEGSTQTFRVRAVRDRIGNWSNTVSVNIGNETLARVKVSGEFSRETGYPTAAAPAAPAKPVPAPAAPAKPAPVVPAAPPPAAPRPVPVPPPPPVYVPVEPPPAAPPPAAPTSTVSIPSVYWNVWQEAGSIGPQFAPVRSLEPGSEYMLFVDLATQLYKGAIFNQKAGGEFVDILTRWARTTKEASLTVKVVLLLSDSFEPAEQIAADLSINLNKLRHMDPVVNAKATPPTFADLITMNDPDFLLGRLMFKVRTRSRNLGMTALGLSIWTNGRPVDELTIPLCIATRTDPDPCAGEMPLVATTFHGLDSFRLADEGGAEPDASLHFMDLGYQEVKGLFHRNRCDDCPYLTWTLKDQTFSEFAKHLTDTLTSAFQEATDDPQRLRIGSRLYNVLFPSGTEHREKAQAAFEQFVQAHTVAAAPSAAPSIFIRMIGADADTTLVPFGMMAVMIDQQLEFIGNRFRVEMPLGVQNYELKLAPVDRWALMVPPDSLTGELGDARTAAKTALDRWLPQAVNQFNTIDGAGKWIGDRVTEDAGTALVVLSHHEKDSFYFNATNKLSVDEFKRTFTRPTVAVLVGCGTGEPAGRLISDLSTRGVTAVIAASTPVSPRMAGNLLTCLADSLDTNSAMPAYTLAHAYYDAVVCLRDTQEHKSRAMTWMLLGNGSIQLRAPRRPQP